VSAILPCTGRYAASVTRKKRKGNIAKRK